MQYIYIYKQKFYTRSSKTNNYSTKIKTNSSLYCLNKDEKRKNITQNTIKNSTINDSNMVLCIGTHMSKDCNTCLKIVSHVIGLCHMSKDCVTCPRIVSHVK